MSNHPEKVSVEEAQKRAVDQRRQREMQARAVVLLTLEIPLTDRWGLDCPLSQVESQARRGAISLLERLFVHPRPPTEAPPTGIRIVGSPIVRTIIASRVEEGAQPS